MLLVSLWSVMLSSLKADVDCHLDCIWNQCRDMCLSKPGRVFPRGIKWVWKYLQQGGQHLPVKADTELWMKTMLPAAFASCVGVSMCVFMSTFCLYFFSMCVHRCTQDKRLTSDVFFNHLNNASFILNQSPEPGSRIFPLAGNWERRHLFQPWELSDSSGGTRVRWWLKRQTGKGMKG